MNKKTILIIFISLFCVSLIANGWLYYQLYTVMQIYNLQQKDAKILDFTGMFIEDVLMANKEIDFDTRLSLETAVRALSDGDIFSQWQRFVKSSTKETSSTEAKILLDLLIKKIKP